MALSPMMQQYLKTKEQYKDCLLMYRLGDFYELFFEDALEASKILDLTLTGRSCGLEEKAPMCGVPYHAVDTYISKLIENGKKVAICEQLTAPVAGKIVERGVVRVVTPGTVIESNILNDKKNNYIVSLYQNNNNIGASYADISTGEFCTLEFSENSFIKINDFLTRIKPTEIICNEQMFENAFNIPAYKAGFLPKFEKYFEWTFGLTSATETIRKQLNVQTIAKYDYAKKVFAISASGALINYLLETQKRSLSHINKITLINNTEFLYLDNTTIKNLELTETIREQKKKGSLLGVLDYTKTSMGARLLYSWVLEPLQNSEDINFRLDAVEALKNDPIKLAAIQGKLSGINDILRLSGKISYGNVMPRDLISLKNSMHVLPGLRTEIKDIKNPMIANLIIDEENYTLLYKFLDKAFMEEPPAIISGGGFVKEGFNSELDSLRKTSSEAQGWLANLEAKEREETGIKNLKIGYTRVFGYYIEVTRSQQEAVPFRYIRKQTISNHERYTTPELREIEEKILNADDLSIKLEQKLFNDIKEYLTSLVPMLQSASSDVAKLDCIASLASVAIKNNYIKPTINEKVAAINIVDGRHPVVETFLKTESFIPNDTLITPKDHTMIITGPNMAGKSTYMRQVALITLLAHMGSFVPAKAAEICITDRIFTRIGASDDLSYGQSTFMVEMSEVSNIINNATSKSLLILDEVGRGTSTYDGLSIAWAVIEYLVQKVKAKTLFATHYHELTQLEGLLDGVKNYRISIKEFNNSIIFLRKIVRGGANKSFGIEVASLAGIYKEIIDRAKVILHSIEQNSIDNTVKLEKDIENISNEKSQVVNMLKELSIENLTPINAFEILNDLICKAKKE